jgi:GH35 family endo-1,4-beta-xylanase
VKFQVFQNGNPAYNFKLCGEYVFGSDGIAIRRVHVDLRNGLIECKKPHKETSGLALLWPVSRFGSLLLPTTALPERDRPYNLNVEITRAKLMQIVNKREDWSILDDPGGTSKEAQELFVQAVQNLSSPSAAAKLADQSLEKAMPFSEKLAIKQAESFFNAKSTSHGFSRGCLGCRLEPARIFEERYVDELMELFGYASVPIRWADIEHEKGKYDFSLIDSCIQVLSKRKLAICAGPLLCFSADSLPEWLMDEKPDFEVVREKAYQFVVKMVSRYADRIRSWIVLSSLNMHNYFAFNFEQTLEMTRAANMAVKSVSNRVLKIVEIGNIWGEYYSTESNSMPPVVYIDMLLQGGIAFDAFGLQLQFGRNKSGMHLRDMMEISAVLDKFALLGKALYITGVEVPSVKDDTEDGQLAGEWHGPWNENLQAQWLEQFYKIALSKPFVDSVVYSNLVDDNSNVIPSSGLLTRKFEPKESFTILKKLHEMIFNR